MPTVSIQAHSFQSAPRSPSARHEPGAWRRPVLLTVTFLCALCVADWGSVHTLGVLEGHSFVALCVIILIRLFPAKVAG